MAKGLSHLHSQITGSLGGLTYQRSASNSISLRTRRQVNQLKTNAAFDSVSLVRDANTTWKNYSQSQRDLVLAWCNLNDYSFCGQRPRTLESARLAFITLYRLTRRTSLLNYTATPSTFLPSLDHSDRTVFFGVWASPAAGQLRLTLGSPTVFSGRYYMRIQGPFKQTVLSRPRGYSTAGSQVFTVNSANSYSFMKTGLQSSRIYFAIVEGVAVNASGVCYLGSWETRFLIT